MSTNSRGMGGGAGGGGGLAPGRGGMTPGFTPFEEEGGPPGGASGVAGATTLFVLVISIIAMGLGADAQRILLTATIALSIYALLNIAAGPGIVLAVTYMAVLGGLRRYSLPFLGYASYDPYLVVGPVVVSLFFVGKLARRDIPRDTPLAKAIFAFVVIMFLEIFNPLQGGLLVGFGGAIYSIVPVLWYYCGRSVGSTHALGVLFRVMVIIAVIQGCYGLYQQFFGFSDIEKQWFAITKSDGGQYLGAGIMRVFGFFVNFAEYVHFIGGAAIIAFAFVIRGKTKYIFPCLFAFFCVFMSSSRGALIGTVGGFGIVWAILAKDRKLWIPRLLVGVVISLLGLQAGIKSINTESLDTTSQVLITHQRNGVLSPETSTGGSHLSLMSEGIMKGITNPLGNGLGAANIGGSKFGTTNGFGSESDIGDVFVCCGAIGGAFFIFIVLRSIIDAANLYHRTRNVLFLAAFGLLVSRIGGWLMSAEYSTIMVLWFCVGILDQINALERKRTAVSKSADVKSSPYARPFRADAANWKNESS